MTFIWPDMLVWLVLVPVSAIAYIQMQRWRQRSAAVYGDPGLVQSASVNRLGLRRHIPAVLFLGAFTILIIALARPQAQVSLPKLEGKIILVFDVSGSMAGDDIKPNRLEAAKAAARDFVDRQGLQNSSGVEIGVVSFSDGGFSTQSPTSDEDQVIAAINRLTVQRGTSISHGIEAALNSIAAGNGQPLTLSTNRSESPSPTPTPMPKGTYTNAAIVLLTDGENNQSPDPLAAAQAAADRGVRIYTVGVGSAEGATLHIQGLTIRSHLDEQTLQQMAEITGGTYYNAQDEEQLQQVYDNLNPQLAIKPQMMEVTSLFAGAGIFVLMVGGLLSLLWLGRIP